jgi:hypothetical protein
MGPRAGLNVVEKRKGLFANAGNRICFSGRPAPSLVTTLIGLTVIFEHMVKK